LSDLVTARMADSTNPAEIPDLFKLKPNGAAAYIDGKRYAWPGSAIHDFPRVWCVSVTGDPRLARNARVIDVERFDATPKDVEPYRAARAAADDHTVVYCSRDTVLGVVEACPAWHELEWWLSTLDGQAWTPSTIVAWIRAELGGLELDPAKIRAIQSYPMGRYDMSRCFGNPRFFRTS
jgi:hypothetical protein